MAAPGVGWLCSIEHGTAMASGGVERRLAASTLEEAMRRAEVSPSGLAVRAGVSRALVRDHLRGAKQPSVAQRARSVRSLGLEPVVDLVPACRPMALHELGHHLVDEVDEARR